MFGDAQSSTTGPEAGGVPGGAEDAQSASAEAASTPAGPEPDLAVTPDAEPEPARPQPKLPTPAQRWAEALDELERDVDVAEAQLHRPGTDAPAGTWTPPEDLGPVPAELQERARALHNRQHDVAVRLGEEITVTRRHLNATEVLRISAPAGPVYVDTTG